MRIEMSARGGMIEQDETTFNYLKDKLMVPTGDEWNQSLTYWKTLFTDDSANFDKEILIDAAVIEPMITYGTNPGMGIPVSGQIPSLNEIKPAEQSSFQKGLEYMGLQAGTPIKDTKLDYVFIGSCTN